MEIPLSSESPRHTSINDIEVIERRGPWESKSGGKLEVALAMPVEALQRFLDFNNPAFDAIPSDMRGLRMYMVSDIPSGSVGGKEWHRARTEFITAITGSAVVDCVDLDGNEQEFILNGAQGIIIPPNILHTYQALEDHTTLQVVANTLFDPEDPRTHDTYPVHTFEK